ncbi:MAG TPA: SUMF1/EgtB/PvdO family nonheme iron enzyme [Anaeromyxobacter sp.]|nr:SUMF1/EgtB/PvdO family nonheme iron enzyme [Anaeromyxobacter sp.]
MASERARRSHLPKIAAFLAALSLAPAPARAAGGGCPSGMIQVAGGVLERDGEPVRVRSFCMDRTEVTVDAYASCVELAACSATDLECGNAATWNRKGHGAHPINCVTWDEAESFCREHGKRLPTEEEWEWAARGGRRALTFPWGEEPPADRACWDGEGNSKGAGERKATCTVGSSPRSRSADGIQDLAGNVREWTSTSQERFRVLRGGSWGDSLPEFLSTSFRGWNAPDERMELLGFRCASPIGAVARRPARRTQTARATTDEAGVMVFSAPIEVGKPASRGKRSGSR